MKKNILFALSAALLAASCEKNDSYYENLPDIYLYATVMEVGVDPTSDDDTQDDADQDDSAEPAIYFQLDNDETFVVAENVSQTDLEDLKVGERVIAGVSLSKDQEQDYTYIAKLYNVVPVWLGELATVTTEQESEDIANDALSYISNNITLTQGYLNLLVACKSVNIDNVKFYLV